jgi:hypothetical protein
VAEPLSLPGRADPLAGEASDDAIDGSSRSCADSSDVVEDGDAGEALFEDPSAPGVGLAEPGVLEACEVQPVVEHPDSREDRSDAEHNYAALPADCARQIRSARVKAAEFKR